MSTRRTLGKPWSSGFDAGSGVREVGPWYHARVTALTFIALSAGVRIALGWRLCTMIKVGCPVLLDVCAPVLAKETMHVAREVMYPGNEKVIIVEGKTDRERLLQIVDEPVKILCTYGSLSYEKIEQVIVPLQDDDVYILVDADESGMKLRNQLKQELPNAKHLYTRKMYREVARTPIEYLAKVLADAHIAVIDSFELDDSGPRIRPGDV